VDATSLRGRRLISSDYLESQMNESSKAAAAVAVLPEKYQPVFGHPGLSKVARAGAKTALRSFASVPRHCEDEIGSRCGFWISAVLKDFSPSVWLLTGTECTGSTS